MNIHIQNIDSSIIHSIEYDYIKKEMIVAYGMDPLNAYCYKDVEPTIIIEFLESESKGKYINSIKNNYEYDLVDHMEGTSFFEITKL